MGDARRHWRFTPRVSLQVRSVRRRNRSTLVVDENCPRRLRRMAAHVHGFRNPVGSLLVANFSFAVDVHVKCCAAGSLKSSDLKQIVDPGGRLFDPLGLAANQSEEKVRI